MVIGADRSLEEPIDLAPLYARAAELRESYVAAQPWPHVVVTGAFPDALIGRVEEECSHVDEANLCSSRSDRTVKDEASEGLGPYTQLLLRTLDAPEFRSFLTAVTGVEDLHDDPTHHLAGLHRTPPGGYTKVHRDFPTHPGTGLHHRLNVLVYLNHDWPASYGGDLQMWAPDMSGVGGTVAPLANTMLIFETSDHSLHGLPDPLTCPPDRARLSVAAYFYTVDPGPDGPRDERGHWVAREGLDPKVLGRYDRLRRATPRPVKRAYHAVRRATRPQH